MSRSVCNGAPVIAPDQRLSRRHSSFRPQLELLEARTLLTAGGTIAGTVFNDAVTNGTRDPGELGLAGITIFADGNDNGLLDADEISTQTGPDGSFSLSFSHDGDVRLRQLEPLGFAQTSVDPVPATLTNGAIVNNVAFGNRRTLAPDQSFVDQAFRDLLGRGVDPGALAAFGSALDQGAMERPQVLQVIYNSPEFRSRQIDEFFKSLLHRSADPGGTQAFLIAYAKGATNDQIEATILASPEYLQTRGDGTDAGFAGSLYQDVLGRAIDSDALEHATAFLAAGGSRESLTQLVLFSPEADSRLVAGLFQQLLRRDADDGALTAFSAALQNGTADQQIAEAVVGSDEYFVRFCL